MPRRPLRAPLFASSSLALLLVAHALAAQPAGGAPGRPTAAVAAVLATPAPASASPATPPGTAAPPTLTVDDPALAPLPPAPKTLQTWHEAIALVESRSPDLRIAEGEVARARGMSDLALGRVLPTLTATGGYTQQLILSEEEFFFCQIGQANPATGRCLVDNSIAERIHYPRTPTYSGQITGRVPLVPRNWYAAGTARLGIDAAKSSASDRRRTLLANLAGAIVNVVTAERTGELNRLGLRTSLERLELTRRRARLGTGTSLDVVRSEQDTTLARNQLLQGDEALRKAREALGLALGESTPYGVPATITLDGIEQSIRTTCTVAKPEDRPDVIAAKRQLEVSRRQIDEARLGFLPTAELNTTFSATNLKQGNLKNYAWTIGALITIPIYEGTRYGELKAAQAVAEQQKARVEAAERQARLDVQQATRAVEVAEQARMLAERGRDLARETARLSQVAYEAGTATSFELVDAGQKLRQAELDLAVKEFQLVQSKIAALLAAASCDG